jgi:hypothetical protein
MFGLTDAECFLLGWAVAATILYARNKERADTNHKILMHFIQDAKAREEIVGAWERFKKDKGMA